MSLSRIWPKILLVGLLLGFINALLAIIWYYFAVVLSSTLVAPLFFGAAAGLVTCFVLSRWVKTYRLLTFFLWFVAYLGFGWLLGRLGLTVGNSFALGSSYYGLGTNDAFSWLIASAIYLFVYWVFLLCSLLCFQKLRNKGDCNHEPPRYPNH